MTTSFKTCLSPEEHIHMYGTLAPEQVAEFMEAYIDKDTIDDVSRLVHDLELPDVSEFDDVLTALNLARPDLSFVEDLRHLLRDSFQDSDRVMVLLGHIEEDLNAANHTLDQIKIDVETLRESTEKFSATLEAVCKEVDERLGV